MHVKLCWSYKATREVLCNWKNSNRTKHIAVQPVKSLNKTKPFKVTFSMRDCSRFHV